MYVLVPIHLNSLLTLNYLTETMVERPWENKCDLSFFQKEAELASLGNSF